MSEVRLIAEAALLPMACVLILVDAWLFWGFGGILLWSFIGLAPLLGVWFGLRENFPVTNRRLGVLAAIVAVLAIILVIAN